MPWAWTENLYIFEFAGELELGDATVQLDGAWGLFL
jgi:hypothetical protein